MTVTAEAPAFTPAKRGMVLVHHETQRDYVTGQPVTERETFSIGQVTSVTRDGIVKRFRGVSWGEACEWSATDQDGPAGRHFRGRVLLAPDIDPAAAVRAAKAHHWPGHPGQPMPFSSLREVRDALRECRDVPAHTHPRGVICSPAWCGSDGPNAGVLDR